MKHTRLFFLTVTLMLCMTVLSSFAVLAEDPIGSEEPPEEPSPSRNPEAPVNSSTVKADIPRAPPVSLVDAADYVEVNNTAVIIRFYRGTAGYNMLYAGNGSLIAQTERVYLEYASGSQWKVRGNPVSVSYV